MRDNCKKGIAILLALTMIFAFAACGNKNQEKDAAKEVKGIVVVCEEGMIAIMTPANELLEFNIENAEIEAEEAIQMDDFAQIEYEGEIKGGDTSGCKVIKVIIQPAEEQEINGKLIKLEDNDNLITIKTKDDETLQFDIEDAEKHYTNGIKVGNDVEIIYTGEIKDGDTSAVHVRSVTDKDENTKAEATVQNVRQSVWVTANDVAIKASNDLNSKRLGTVNKNDKLTRTGILSDGWSRLEYKGDTVYISSQYLTTTEPTKKTEARTTTTKKKETTTMVGTVISADNGVLHMDTPVGQEFSFKLSGAKVYTSIDPDDPITVVFEGNEAMPGKLIKVY